MKKNINFTNIAGNIGNELIKKIYASAHQLEATEVIVKSGKYGRYAIVDLMCEDGYIAENYIISL